MSNAAIGFWQGGGNVGPARLAFPFGHAPTGIEAWLARLLLAVRAESVRPPKHSTHRTDASSGESNGGFENKNSEMENGEDVQRRREDASDIRAALAGDSQAFGRLTVRYQPMVAALMWRFTRQRVEWETLVQDVLVEAYYSLPNYRGRGSYAGWLRTIATRIGYRYWKLQARARRRGDVPLEDWDGSHAAGETQPALDDAAEAGQMVHRLLAELPPRDRLVLTLLYLEDCSTAEIAERVGWSRTMVKVQAHRARQKLKKLLERAGLSRLGSSESV